MSDQPSASRDQPPVSADDQAVPLAMAPQRPDPNDPQPRITGLDATVEPPPELVAAMEAAKGTQDSGLGAILKLAGPLSGACPRLAKILGSAAVRTGLEIYASQDAESVRQQELLKREAFWSNVCLLAAGVISGLILAISAGALASLAIGPFRSLSVALADEAVKSSVILILGLLTLALGAFAAYFAYIARDQGRVARWQTCRAEAETARLDVFSAVASAAGAADKNTALFGLAVVVTHLLDDQRAWLLRRAKQHRHSSEQTTRMGATASALAFIGGSGAIIASQTTDSHGAIWIVLAGIVGSAIGAFAANREALNRDRANAERYDKTRMAMDALSSRVDGVAAKIGSGQPEALSAFTKTITDLLSAENKQWLDGTAQANAAIEKLDEQLNQLGKPKN